MLSKRQSVQIRDEETDRGSFRVDGCGNHAHPLHMFAKRVHGGRDQLSKGR